MDDNQGQHLEELKQIHQTRLSFLEKQAAHFGVSAPPHILMEIENIRNQISVIDAKLSRLATPHLRLIQPQKITILFLSADPNHIPHLRLGQELREIKEKLQLSALRDRFRLESRESLRPADISQAMLDTNPQIVHFSGHGTDTGELCFEDLQGELHPVGPEALTALFERFANHTNCVILNACSSEKQANAIAQHVDYVVGMNQAIDDRASISFSIGFYQALGAGHAIEEAYKFGRVQISLQGIPEYLTPVLIKKGKAHS